MKTLEEVKKELEKQFLYRLQLRKDRKMKNCCRNCKIHKDIEFDLGDFGKQIRYVCGEEHPQLKKECPFFICSQTEEEIEEDMLADLKDPAICGAKEPKIAALLWVLHVDTKNEISPFEEKEEENKEEKVEEPKKKGIFAWLGRRFK